MQRIATSSRVQDLHGAGKDGFGDGTTVSLAWLNQVQEAIVRMIEAAGLTPDATFQLKTALDLLYAQVRVVGARLEYFADTGKTLDISGQSTTSNDVQISSDGLRLYVLDANTDDLFQYNLTTPWDLETASYASKFFDFNGQDAAPVAFHMSPDGTKLYMLGAIGNETIYQYTLSTPFELDTVSFDSVTENVNAVDSAGTSITFSADGTKLYYLGSGSGGDVYQFTLSTPWDLDTASYDSISMSALPSHRSVEISPDGKRLILLSSTNDDIDEYLLPTPFVLTGGTASGVEKSVEEIDSTPRAVSWSPNGRQLYYVGRENNDVYQFTTNLVAATTG